MEANLIPHAAQINCTSGGEGVLGGGGLLLTVVSLAWQ